MTIDVIDTSTYVRPSSGYTGLGTVDGHSVVDGGMGNHTTGFFTSTGNATQLNIGFRPRNIFVVNETDVITWTWTHGMAVANSLKFTNAADMALDTSSQLTPSESATGTGNWIVTIGATACGTSKNICFSVEG